MTLDDLITTARPFEEQQGEAWGRIVPFDTPDLPPFPADLFDDAPWLRSFVEAVAEATQTPIDLAGMLALAVLATCCQRCVMVEGRPGWVEPTNLYNVVALPPASRKSSVFRAFIAPLIAHEQKRAIEAKKSIAEMTARKDILEAQLDTAKREASRGKNEHDSRTALEKVDELAHELALITIPKPPRLIVDDVTPEALATLLTDHQGRMAALSPEGDVFAIMAGRYSSGSGPNFGVFLKAHAGDTLRVDRRSRSEFVDWPALTLGITTQPDVVRGLAEKAGFRGQGLLGRFLYALPISLVGSRQIDATPVPEHVRMDYHEQVAALLSWRNAHSGNSGNSGNENHSGDNVNYSLIDDSTYIYLLNISSSANILLTNFLAWLEPLLAPDAAFGSFADWAGKLAGAALRIAALLHMASLAHSHNTHNTQNEISEQTMARVLDFTHYLIAHAKAAFQEMGADPAIAVARRTLAWIERSSTTQFSKRDLWQAIRGSVSRADDLDPVLKILSDHGYVRPIEFDRAGPGRKPSQRYEVHPLIGSHNTHNTQNSIPRFNVEIPEPAPAAAPATYQNGHAAASVPRTTYDAAGIASRLHKRIEDQL